MLCRHFVKLEHTLFSFSAHYVLGRHVSVTQEANLKLQYTLWTLCTSERARQVFSVDTADTWD